MEKEEEEKQENKPVVVSDVQEEGEEVELKSPSSSSNNNNITQSITALGKEEFGRTEYGNIQPTKPVIVKDFGVRKDAYPTSCCTGPADQHNGLELAPNFASAILGRWLASKIGLGGPTPPATDLGGNDDSEVSSSSTMVVENITALLLPGEGTLLLGPSSSGKTTLMRTISDIIRQQLSTKQRQQNVIGNITIGGIDPFQTKFNLSRAAAFVDQGDLSLTPILTVNETIQFARQCAEKNHPDNTKLLQESITNIFKLAGLDHVRDTIVGNADIRGVSGGQKRRVKTLEMAVGDSIGILFLDEITNGLDASSAFSICKVVQTLLQVQGMIAITCLLQPSEDVFSTFDRLLLLTPDGKLAYSGKTNEAVSYFQQLGLNKPEGMNVPEFLLRCTVSPQDFWDTEQEIPKELQTSTGLADAFRKSESYQKLISEIENIKKSTSSNPLDQDSTGVLLTNFATPLPTQILLNMKRGWKLVQRNPASLMRVVFAIIFGRKS